jgi:hypothetical protein
METRTIRDNDKLVDVTNGIHDRSSGIWSVISKLTVPLAIAKALTLSSCKVDVEPPICFGDECLEVGTTDTGITDTSEIDSQDVDADAIDPEDVDTSEMDAQDVDADAIDPEDVEDADTSDPEDADTSEMDAQDVDADAETTCEELGTCDIDCGDGITVAWDQECPEPIDIYLEVEDHPSRPDIVQNGTSAAIYNLLSLDNIEGNVSICLGTVEDNDGSPDAEPEWIPASAATIQSVSLGTSLDDLDSEGCANFTEQSLTGGELQLVGINTRAMGSFPEAEAIPELEVDVQVTSSAVLENVIVENYASSFQLAPVLPIQPTRLNTLGERSLGTNLMYGGNIPEILCMPHDNGVNLTNSGEPLSIEIDSFEMNGVDTSALTVTQFAAQNVNGTYAEGTNTGGVWTFNFTPSFTRDDNCYAVWMHVRTSSTDDYFSYSGITVNAHATANGEYVPNSEVSVSFPAFGRRLDQ